MPSEIKIHPAANLFPMMGDKEYRELVADIKANGLRQSVMMVGDTRETAQIIDGRNRAKALAELGLDLNDHADVMDPDDIPDPVEFVLSLNLHRRHLTESQRAMVASKVATLRDGEKKGTSIDVPAKSQADAAAQLNVGIASVQRARKVQEQAVPAIVEAVERGEVSVSAAAEVSKLPPKQQQKLAEAGPVAIKQAAAEKRTEAKTSKAAGPLQELRVMFDGMDKPDEQAICQFCEWIMSQHDPKTTTSGAALWIEWSRK